MNKRSQELLLKQMELLNTVSESIDSTTSDIVILSEKMCNIAELIEAYQGQRIIGIENNQGMDEKL